MKKRHDLFAAAVLSAALMLPAAARGAESDSSRPMISYHTTLYDLAGTDNAFSIFIGAREKAKVKIDNGIDVREYDVAPTGFEAGVGVVGTTIATTVSAAGDIKIYSDTPLAFDYLNLNGCYITTIDFEPMADLEILDLSYNQLDQLDLTPFTKLQALYLTDNDFRVKPLIVGGPKPDLQILQMAQVMSLDQSFDLRDYPELRSLIAYSCHSLRRVDPTGCPKLMQLSIDATQVASVNVSKNPELLILNVSDTRVTSLDVSHNPKLQQLYCGHGGSYSPGCQIRTLNLSNNPDLIHLECAYNGMTSLDVSRQANLQSLNCRGNYLTAVNIDNNRSINSLQVSDNCLDFVTLPAPREMFAEYFYYSQKPFAVNRSYKEGDVIDFSAKVNRPGTTTTATLYAYNEANPADPVALDESYYTYNNGVLTLRKAHADSLYMEFKNSLLNEWSLTSGKFVVKTAADFGKDVIAFSFNPAQGVTDIAMSVGIGGATAASPRSFSVDFGDGNPVAFTATTHLTPASPNVSGQRKGTGPVIVYMPEGSDMTALAADGVSMATLDVSKSPCLSELSLTRCAITGIDLRRNRCLTYLNLSDNNLKALDLDGLNGNYNKNVLTTVIAPRNNISAWNDPDNSTLVTLDLSHNALTAIPLARASRLETLDVSHNRLTEIDLNDCEALATINCSDNEMTSLPVPSYTPLQHVDVSLNRFTFSSLAPAGSYETYVYAPQREVIIPLKAPMVNLSSELFDSDGESTRFTWLTSPAGTPLTAAQVTDNGRGVFRFTDENAGSVYCSMTHPLFPDFAGDKALRTTVLEVAPMPTDVVASFKTKATGKGEISMRANRPATVIYIDWTGKGDIEQYMLGDDTYSAFPVSVTSGAEVSVYAYDSDGALTVFSLGAGPLESIDVSKLTGLSALMIYGSELPLESMKLPEAELSELSLTGAPISSFDFSRYPNLRSLVLSGCLFETLDISSLKSLRSFNASSNKLKNITFDNPLLWGVSLTGNNLTSIDISRLPALEQLQLSHNSLSDIDAGAVAKLRALQIDNNRFTFATLPPVRESYAIYDYADQALLTPELNGNTVDLSAQASVGGVPTVFRWFVYYPEINEDGELVGDELRQGWQYDLTDGVTTFFGPTEDETMCIMTNAAFPNLLLMTDLIDTTGCGLSDVIGGGSDFGAEVIGRDILVSAPAGAALRLVSASGAVTAETRADASGAARFTSVAPGVYVISSPVIARGLKAVVR